MTYQDSFFVYVNHRRRFRRTKNSISPNRWNSYEEVVDGLNKINNTTLEDWKLTDGTSSLTLKVGNWWDHMTITVMPSSEIAKAIA